MQDNNLSGQLRSRWRGAGGGLLLGLLLAIAAVAEPALTPGARGYGLTVMAGTRIDTFQVEVLGVQRNASLPGRDQIVVRLSGLGLEDTGILRGMSGSPVYIDGRLVGAVAYGWLYAEEPVGLLTPIHDMLALLQRDLSAPALTPGATDAAPGPRLGVWLGGGGPGTLSLAEQLLSPLGLEPLAVPAGGAPDDASAPALTPGAAVALRLVGGDLSLAAIGTVTAVEGERVVCFGHPFLGTGAVDLPMAAAHIFGVLDNTAASFKLGVATRTVGAIRQDRSAGVAGVLGAGPPMLPLRVDLAADDGDADFTFDVARHPLLTSSLCQISLLGALESTAKAMGAATLELTVEAELTDGRRTRWRRAYTGRNAFMMAALGVGPPLRSLLESAFADVRVADVSVHAAVREAIAAARIDGARLARPRVTAGATVDLTVRLVPWRGAPRQLVVPLTIPDDVVGPVTVHVGSGGAALAWNEARLGGVPAPDSDALLARLRRPGADDELVVELTTGTPGVAVGDRELPAPPPSVRRLLDETYAAGGARPLTERLAATVRRPVDTVLSGEHTLTLTVVPKGSR